jgi:heme-degrading monooxygenase HmoA
MAKVFSLHEYVLQPGVDEDDFKSAVHRVQEMGLLQLPGLVDFQLVKGIKGSRRGHFAVLWIYESRDAWQRLWGPPDEPLEKENYPENWRIWEEEILAPFLEGDPDQIRYTTYEEWTTE